MGRREGRAAAHIYLMPAPDRAIWQADLGRETTGSATLAVRDTATHKMKNPRRFPGRGRSIEAWQ